MERITDYLVADHVRLAALLTEAAETPGFGMEAYRAFRAGILRHIAIEEKLLLPAARRANGGRRLSRAYELRVQHAAVTSLLVPTPSAAICREIAGILDKHNAVEEGAGGIYEECEALFSSAESEALCARARDYRPVALAPHYDGPGVYRTAEAALAAASRIKRAPEEQRSEG